MNLKHSFLIHIVFLIVCNSYSFAMDIGEIYDAVFSPDGQTIGVGTSTGFHLFDRSTMKYIDSIVTDGGVHFILWFPNEDSILTAQWKNTPDQPDPIYSIWSINNKELLYSFRDRIRWLYRYGDIHYSNTTGIDEGTFPSRNAVHCANIAISPDNRHIAFIDINNQILIYDISSKSLTMTIETDMYHFTSLGYCDVNTLWIGIILIDRMGYSNESKIVKYKLLIKQYGDTVHFESNNQQKSAYVPVLVTDDNKYVIISYSTPMRGSVSSILQHILFDLSIDKFWGYLASAVIYPASYGFVFQHRSRYSKENNTIRELFIHGASTNDNIWWGSRIISMSNFETKEMKFEKPMEGFLLQPFSPDGEEFLHLYKGILYLFDTDSLEYQQILPSASSVRGYLELKEK